MRNGQPEAVIYEGVIVSKPMMIAREVARELGFLTVTHNYPEHANESLSTETDAVITILNDYDASAPQIKPEVEAFLEHARELEIPVAYISNHDDIANQLRLENGDIAVRRGEDVDNVESSMRPWLGDIAARVLEQSQA